MLNDKVISQSINQNNCNVLGNFLLHLLDNFDTTITSVGMPLTLNNFLVTSTAQSFFSLAPNFSSFKILTISFTDMVFRRSFRLESLGCRRKSHSRWTFLYNQVIYKPHSMDSTRLQFEQMREYVKQPKWFDMQLSEKVNAIFAFQHFHCRFTLLPDQLLVYMQ